MSVKSQSIESKKQTGQDERLKKISPLRVLLNRPELGALGGSILVFIFFGIVAGDTGMFSAYGALNFLDVSANLGIIAIAAAMLMIGGEFDLSIGSMIGFAGICIAIPAIYWGWPLWMSITFAFAMAVLIGYFNGIMVVRTGLPSFIVTLAMLFILRGATLAITRLITGRTQVPGLRVLIEDDPIAWLFATDTFQWLFTWLGKMKLIALRTDGTPLATGIPPSVIWFIALTLFATWILMKTRYGNWIFASGGDKVGATNVGVPVGRVKISLFIGTAVATAVPINKLIFTLPTGTPTLVAPTLSPPDANIQLPYLVFINIHVANSVRAINHITEGGIPVASGVPSVLNAINFILPNQVNNHWNVSVANNQAIGSSSISTLNPGTCVLPVINRVIAKVAPLKINSIASVTINEGRPVLTTIIPLKYPIKTAIANAKVILIHNGQPQYIAGIAIQIPANPIIEPIDKSNSPPIINIAAAIAIIPKFADTSKKFRAPYALNIPVSPATIPKNINTKIDPPKAPSSGLFNKTLKGEIFFNLSSCPVCFFDSILCDFTDIDDL